MNLQWGRNCWGLLSLALKQSTGQSWMWMYLLSRYHSCCLCFSHAIALLGCWSTLILKTSLPVGGSPRASVIAVTGELAGSEPHKMPHWVPLEKVCLASRSPLLCGYFLYLVKSWDKRVNRKSEWHIPLTPGHALTLYWKGRLAQRYFGIVHVLILTPDSILGVLISVYGVLEMLFNRALQMIC